MSEDECITTVLVDDHMFVRKGIRAMVEKSPDIIVVGEAETPQAALEMISEERPCVVVLDLQMPGVTGADLCRRIATVSPESAILVLSAFLNPQLLRSCLASGARGYLLKETEDLDIVSAIKTVAHGGTVFDRRTSTLEQNIHHSGQIFALLSPKELQVLSLLCQGLTNNEIAEELRVSLNTIKAHLKAIMRKLNCRNRIEIVLRARELNLFSE
jgi:DNA-binding NarL/FixJ family response regulator